MSFAKRCLSTLIDVKGKSQPRDFSLCPGIFTVPEQRILLATALQKLDALESRPFRRRRNAFIHGRAKETLEQSQDLQSLFVPDEYYQMEEVRFFHSVSRTYRPMVSRDTTTALSAISARCMSRLGRKTKSPDFPR